MNYYLAPNLNPDNHAFFDRTGGVSQGIYNSLNFNYKSNDNPRCLIENMNIVADYYGVPPQNIVRLYQDHTNKAVFIDRPSQYQFRADGVVTNRRGLVLGITTADCAPVLFADHKNGIIGAAHAGWRGVLFGIIEHTIDIMLRYGARINNIAVAVGPCLQKESFEVKDDMMGLFVESDHEMYNFFNPVPGKKGQFLCDLEGIIGYRLARMGIDDVSFSEIDTYSNPDSFFSYRRNCHQGLIKTAGDFPIQLSTICL